MSGGWIDAALAGVLAADLGWLLLGRRRSRATSPPAEDAAAGTLARLLARHRRLARQAGLTDPVWRLGVWPAKLVCAAVLALATARAVDGTATLPLTLVAAVVGFLLPDLQLLALRRRRQRRIRGALSFFLDLLAALLQAGLELGDAFRRAGRALAAGNPLAWEVARIGTEIDAGRSRGDAFQALAGRTGVAELHGVAAALAAGLRLGTPLETLLTEQAEALRERRHDQVLASIRAASLGALVPLVLCGFPLFLVLVLFPAASELIDTWRELIAAWR